MLIIDEFQDTDPLQVEIARLLAGDAPGGLVVVGDAKQSIYRFRRAEVAHFRAMAEEARAGDGRAVLSLTQNFRSRPAILRFVNRAFAELIQASVELGQPAYEPVHPPAGLGDDAGGDRAALRGAARGEGGAAARGGGGDRAADRVRGRGRGDGARPRHRHRARRARPAT